MHVLGRPRSYDFQDYLGDFRHIAAALPNVPVAGPSSGSAKYLAGLGDYLSHEPRVRLVAVHAYPLRHCTHSQLPTIAALLAPETTRALAAKIGADASVAHRHGVALRLDETNSVSCGGYPPVSQSFGAALWALGELFALDRAGVDGVNFHTVPDDSQHLITTSQTAGKWTAAVQPEYYGLLAFAQAAPAGSRLIRVSGHLATGVQVYATAAGNHQVHVVIINTSGRTRALDLRIPGSTGPVSRSTPERARSGGAGQRHPRRPIDRSGHGGARRDAGRPPGRAGRRVIPGERPGSQRRAAHGLAAVGSPTGGRVPAQRTA